MKNNAGGRILEHWKKGPGGEHGKTTQKVLKEHRLATFKKSTDLRLLPDPDKNSPTHSFDDSAYPLEDSFLWPPDLPYLGRWGSWRDDIGLVDNRQRCLQA